MTGSLVFIEDDPDIRKVISSLLRRSGMEVFTAGAGLEGIDAFEELNPDVCLIDLNLPDISGFEVLEKVVGAGGTAVILTGQGDVPTAVRAIQLGAENFLTKPVDTAHLVAALARAVEKARLKRETARLRTRDWSSPDLSALGDSPVMRQLREQIRLLAENDQATVLLSGESGTGKGHAARLIHELSPRRKAPFVQVNCAGLSANLLESEMFGHEKGSFTDAKERKLGLLESAHAGTVLLDEIGELSPELQPKLLQVLEERTFRRVGGTREIALESRILAATNRDLEADVRRGRFREDLFYRLSVFPLRLPALRDRTREDLLSLLKTLLAGLEAQFPGGPRDLDTEVRERLLHHEWPGNVREMRNVLERILILAGGASRIRVEHLPPEFRTRGRKTPVSQPGQKLTDVERAHIVRTLSAHQGNRSRTARALGISRTTLIKKIKDYGLVS
jgi:DNA-binding NtrC family response regulator